MNLGELRDKVGRKIKRPELVDDINDAINEAIEFASTQGDYAWDLVEGSLVISSSVLAQNIVISTSFTRFRKVKYLRPSGYTRYLKWKDPSRIFTDKGVQLNDCYYRSGDNIIFSLSQYQAAMLYGFLQYPTPLVADADSNDYTEQMGSAIQNLACAYMFDQIGNEQESARLERRAMRLLLAHKADKQDGVSQS